MKLVSLLFITCLLIVSCKKKSDSPAQAQCGIKHISGIQIENPDAVRETVVVYRYPAGDNFTTANSVSDSILLDPYYPLLSYKFEQGFEYKVVFVHHNMEITLKDIKYGQEMVPSTEQINSGAAYCLGSRSYTLNGVSYSQDKVIGDEIITWISMKW